MTATESIIQHARARKIIARNRQTIADLREELALARLAAAFLGVLALAAVLLWLCSEGREVDLEKQLAARRGPSEAAQSSTARAVFHKEVAE